MARVALNLIPEGLQGLCWLSAAARPRHPRRRSPHSHAEIEANLVETGSCRYLIDGRVQLLHRGDLFWLFPDQPHMIIDASADMSLWVLIARPGFAPQRGLKLPSSAAERPPYARPHRLREADRLHLSGVAAALAACEDDAAHHADGLAWWLAEAARLTEQQEGRVGKPLHPAVIKALSLLETDPSLPLPALADAVHVSASRLSHLFVEQLESTVSAHRNQIRLRRFQDRLATEGVRNLTQAAFDAGFGSYAQFARVLRASTGLNPRTMLGPTTPSAVQPKMRSGQPRAPSAAARRR